MIYIEERAPVSLPGWSSLFVNFDYNSKIVECIKAVTIEECITKIAKSGKSQQQI